MLRSLSLEIFVAFVSARIGSASDLLTSGADDEEEGEPEDVDAFRDQVCFDQSSIVYVLCSYKCRVVDLCWFFDESGVVRQC